MINFDKLTEEVFEKTQKQIDEFGPRETGSKSCINCADALYEDMKSFADSSSTEDFGVHTGAALGWLRIEVVLFVLGVVFLWLRMPLVTGMLLLLGIIILVLQFIMYKHFTDFLYPRKTGRNVIGVVEPQGEVKRQIIISGHHDSQHVFNFFIHQPKLYGLRIMGGIGSLIVVCVLSFAAFFIAVDWFIVLVAVLASICSLIVVQLWFYVSKDISPGAGDNLIASNIAVEALRQIAKDKKEGNVLKHTRVMAVSFDAEEEGLRGAYAYAKKNKEMLNEVPTYLYNIDCPYYLKDIFYLTSDINTGVKLSEEFAGMCKKSAEKLGYSVQVKPITFLTGGTDAGELAKVGVHATTMMAMPWDNSERASVYHTPNDTCDAVEKEAVKATLEIFFDVVKNMDA